MSYHTSGSASSSGLNITPPTSSSNGTRTSNNIASGSSDPSSEIGKVSVRPLNTGSVTQAEAASSQYKYQVTLQFSTKTDFYYWNTDLEQETAILPFAQPRYDDDRAENIPVYNEEESYALETKTIKWTIGSNAPIIYGYHLDGSPYVHDNSTVDGGGLYLVSVTDGNNDTLARTEYNAWYEPVEISGTAINPDNGKIPSTHKGQLSRGSQEADVKFYADKNDDGTYDHRVEIALKPWLGIDDYIYSCIPPGRGFADDDYSVDNDDNPILFGAPIADDDETIVNGDNYGLGRYAQGYVYPNYYDGRGQVCDFISGNQNQFPRDKVTTANVDDADQKDKSWLRGYRDAPRRDDYDSSNDDQKSGAPWLTEGQWLTVEQVGSGYYGPAKDNETGYNYLGIDNGLRGNRTGVRSGTLPYTVSRDIALTNSGLIKDRDGIERWSGTWTPEAKEQNGDPYKLKAHDLVVSQIGHWDHRGVDQFRNYCKQRYQLYTVLLDVLGVDVDNVADTDADFSWYPVANVGQTGFDFFPDTPLPDEFNQLVVDKFGDDSSLPENVDSPTFRDYEKTYLNKYNKTDKLNNLQGGTLPGGVRNYWAQVSAWGNYLDSSNRKPFVDMTACLSVVPPVEELPEDINDDGKVTGGDITQILSYWGPVNPDDPRSVAADINGDGVVNGEDLTLILAAWGQEARPEYNNTFRPPLNWDPTDRKSAPYITEIDDVDNYTIDGPGVNPTGSDLDEITPGQIGYPDKSIDGYPTTSDKGMSWEIYTGDKNARRYSENDYPYGLNMTLADIYWPELKLPTKEDLVGRDNDPDDPSTWDYPSVARRNSMLGKASPLSLRLGSCMVWQYAATADNRTQGNRDGYDISTSTYGSAEGSENEILSFFAFDRNLDPENLNRAVRINGDPSTYNISPSLSWLRYHYGSDWDKDPNGDPKRADFNLRKVIRRALSQRGIDYYGGQRSCGKYIASNAGHTDIFDYQPIIGLACTQYSDWVEMLDKGELGNTRNGTFKDTAHRIGKDDPDYTYNDMNNSGTIASIGELGPCGNENVTNIFGNQEDPNGQGAYNHGTLRFKDLGVKSVDDFANLPYPNSNESSNEYRGQTVQPQDLPDVFPNQLLTIYPPVGGEAGNQIDTMFFRLKEIVDRDSDIFNGLLSGEVSAQDMRDLTWRGLYSKDVGNHIAGDEITSWIGTDTPDAPYGINYDEPAQPVNRLQSGVDPEWVADVDKQYSLLHEVPSENLVRYDGQYFNVIRRDENGNDVTNGNYYRPHKDIWNPITEDFRSMDRQDGEGNQRTCDDSYANQYLGEVIEGSTIEDTKYSPLNGLYPRNYNPQDPSGAKMWALKDNQDAMTSNFHKGLYIKNTTEGSPDFGKITLVIASAIEHVRHSECCESVEGYSSMVKRSTDDIQKATEIEGMREIITGKNSREDFGPSNRAMRFLVLDDIGLTDDDGNLLPNAKVEIGHNLIGDFSDEDIAKPGVNTYASGGGMSNTSAFGSVKSYMYVWNRGTFLFGMLGRMFAKIEDGAIVRHKPLSEIMDSMPEYYARLYVKYPTFWNNCVGRAITEEDTNSNHAIFQGGNPRGVIWNDGRRDVKLENWPSPGNAPDDFYGGEQWKELMRALFNQELVQRITDPETSEAQIASRYRDPETGRKWLRTMKERLYRWKNQPDVIGSMSKNGDGELDFSGDDIIPIADPPSNITALAKSSQTKPFLWYDNPTTFDAPDGQQVTMAKNNNSDADSGDHTIGSSATGGPEWITHQRVFNNDGTEKTGDLNKAGLRTQYTVLGKNTTGTVDLDKLGGNEIDDYDSYLNNDGIRLESSTSKDGVLPYKQFVEGKSLYVWFHGNSQWQELVLVSESVSGGNNNTITSHGPRSGAAGFEDDPIEWEQVWVLPNYTEEGKPLAVWPNMSDTFRGGGLGRMTFFYADPQ
jgi:hypothetical protein